MDRKQATKVLGSVIKKDGSLHEQMWYLSWKPGEDSAELDGVFESEELEAIAWIMKNNIGKMENV